MLFPNLPVSDLERCTAFWTALGFSFNAQFTNEHAACLVINDQASVMLLRESFWSTFTTKPLPDRRATTGLFLAFSCESRDEVTRLVECAFANGGTPASPPQDHGFMLGWSFLDPEGHHWEAFWMDPAHVQPTS